MCDETDILEAYEKVFGAQKRTIGSQVGEIGMLGDQKTLGVLKNGKIGPTKRHLG